MLQQLKIISFISCIGFICGPIIGAILDIIPLVHIGIYKIHSNMLKGYFIMMLCVVMCVLTIIFFESNNNNKKKQKILIKRNNTFTRTLTIRPRCNNLSTSPPKYTVVIPKVPNNININNNINNNNHKIFIVTPPPSKIIPIKSTKNKPIIKKNGIMNGHYIPSSADRMITNSPSKSDSHSTKSTKSTKSNRSNRSNLSNNTQKRYKFSDLRWLDSASPPSTLPRVDSDDELNEFDPIYNPIHHASQSKLRINISGIRNSTRSTSNLSSMDSQVSYRRSSIAEVLNMESPSVVTPYTPHAINQDDDEEDENDQEDDEEEYIEELDSKKAEEAGNSNTNKKTERYSVVNRFGSFVMSFCFLIHFSSFSIQQTMTSYILQTNFNWNVLASNYLFIFCGILWMISLFWVNKLLSSPSSSKYTLVKLSLFLGVLSTFCLIDFPHITYNLYLFILGFILMSFTFPFGRASVLSVYSLCTDYKYIEWIYFVSMISRICTPFICIGLYFMSNGPSWIYGSITILFMTAIILFALSVPRLTKKTETVSTSNKHYILNHGYSVLNISQVFYMIKR